MIDAGGHQVEDDRQEGVEKVEPKRGLLPELQHCRDLEVLAVDVVGVAFAQGWTVRHVEGLGGEQHHDQADEDVDARHVAGDEPQHVQQLPDAFPEEGLAADWDDDEGARRDEEEDLEQVNFVWRPARIGQKVQNWRKK